MKIETDGDMIDVYSPYNPDFVKKIKGIGGAKWEPSKKCWIVPEDAVDVVRGFMVDVYGYSDIKENETISLKITVNNEIACMCEDVMLFGKIVSHATGRDSGAKMGNDVSYISGAATSGGSEKHWKSVVEAGSVVMLSNVNKNIFEKYEKEYNEKYDITIEVLENKINKQKLLEEKERLVKRIEEIDRLLQEAGRTGK